MIQPDEVEFLKGRRGTSHNPNQVGFQLFTDTATKASNLMQNPGYGDELDGLIAQIVTDGEDVPRDGAWRLDTDQSPVEGGSNHQIQLNNRDSEGGDTGASTIRKNKGTTSATCVLVQNGAHRIAGYYAVLSQAHSLSRANRCGIILALPASIQKVGSWTCSKCERSASGKAQFKPKTCFDNRKNTSQCRFTHAA